jgi:hypothetical protein
MIGCHRSSPVSALLQLNTRYLVRSEDFFTHVHVATWHYSVSQRAIVACTQPV